MPRGNSWTGRLFSKHLRNKIYVLLSYDNAIDLVDGVALYEIEEWGMILHSIVLYRVAEVGRLSASAKNTFNSFVGRVFANSRQKMSFFSCNTKITTKMVVFT